MRDDVGDAANYLKFAAALISVARSEFQTLRDSGSPAAAEAVLARLRLVHAELSDAAARFCPDDENAQAWMARYDDGRAVMTVMAMGQG